MSWNNGVVNSPIGTTNKCLLMQNKFMDMFKYKNLQWLMDDSYTTRRRLVDGILQESLLDQVLVSNIDITRDLKIVSPLGKSDHLGIVFEIKCSNNTETLTKSKDNWGKFSKSDIENCGKAIDWSYSSPELSSEEMWEELESKLLSISSETPKFQLNFLLKVGF